MPKSDAQVVARHGEIAKWEQNAPTQMNLLSGSVVNVNAERVTIYLLYLQD